MSAVSTSPSEAQPIPDAPVLHPTREAWLQAAADALWPMVTDGGGKRPDKFRVSCGWPVRSALPRAGSSRRCIGECWVEGSDDGTREVFVSPVLAHPVEVMDVLLHELIHAALPKDAGHGPAFKRVMKVVGLEGKPTATVAGDGLVATLEGIAERLGRYPHAKLDALPRLKKQAARLLKVECPDCGYTIRVTRAWIEVGLPLCPCGTRMESVEFEVEGETLTLQESVLAYATADGRFRVQTSKVGRRAGKWMITDLHADGLPLAIRPDREDALRFIEAVRVGEQQMPGVDVFDGLARAVEEDEEALGKLGDWGADESDLYLADDEDEVHDYPEDELEAHEEREYDLVSALRDASGSATSERIIAAGGEGAMD